MNPMLSAVHFQLTGRCNLRCVFCGQQNGMFAGPCDELKREDWFRLAGELPAGTEVTLWGGEPLLCDYFADLARDLFRRGCRLRIVTNGTLIDRHAEVLNECFDVINVSLDGPAEYHDRFRGEGVFAKVAANLKLLRTRRGKLAFLTTIADANVGMMADLPRQLAALQPDEIVLQQLMYFSAAEISAYRQWLRDNFQQDDPGLEVWRRDDDREYLAELKKQYQLALGSDYPMKVTLRMHDNFIPCAAPCRAAEVRCHIKYDGSVLYCTDFYGFTAGNIRQTPLRDIFVNERSERFRREIAAGHNPLCRHCSWHGGMA